MQLCLQSLLANSKHLSLEVIVVDNASGDGAPEMVETEFPEVRLIRNERNLGFSKANNQGAAIADGKYLLLMNPDVVVGEDCLSRLWRFAEEKRDIGAIGLRYVDGTGHFLPESKRNFPGRMVALNKLFGEGKGYYAEKPEEFETGEVQILAGAFLFMQTSVYRDHKGFDEDFFMFGEDIDLCHRIARSGLINLYKGDQTILHFKGQSSEKNYAYYRNFYGAMDIFYSKVYGKNLAWRLLVSPLLGLMARVRSIHTVKRSSADRPKGNMLYVGNREDVARRLAHRFPDALFISSDSMPTDWTGIQEVFYDSASLSMTEIIDSISDLGNQDICKRIIINNGNLYLGSDSSTEMGLVGHF